MAVTKKIRFEVFKRDAFQCAYCGKTPPEVALECDHIQPKSKGGVDDINNLITACFDCNRGKRDIPLEKAPAKLTENYEVLQEKESQLAEYHKFLRKIEKRIQKEIGEIGRAYEENFPGFELAEKFKRISLKKFLRHIPVGELIDYMHTACSIVPKTDESVRYFCGMCWNKIKGKQHNG